MKINYKSIFLYTTCGFLLVSCGPKKQEEKPPEQKEAVQPSVPEQKEKPDTSLMYPEHLGPGTPQEQQLEINEDNVMNPFPG